MYFLGTFESADLNQFTSSSGSLQSTLPKEDTYGGLNTNNTVFLKNINTDYGEGDKAKTWAGAWFLWDTDILNGWYVMLANGAANEQWILQALTGGKLKLTVNGVTYNGTAVLAKNTWYFICVEFYCHDTAGYAKVFINGVQDISTGTIDSKTGTDTGVRQIKWQGINTTGNCYLDNCLFADYDPNFGLKVSKPGKEATSMDSKNLIFNSQMTFLKFHGEYTASVVFNPGDKTKTVEITHGLGYVPAFMSYGVRSDNGVTFIIPSIPYGVSEFDFAEVWADTQKIYFKASLFYGWNELKFAPDAIYHNVDSGSVNILVGNAAGGGQGSAFRFPAVSLNRNQAITSANIEFQHEVSGPTNSNTKMKVWGIDEDNIGDIDTGKSKTSAETVQEQSKLSGFFNFASNIKSQVEEIIARTGWVSGNNMGFIVYDNGSAGDAYIGGDNSSTAILTVQKYGNLTVNFRVVVFKDKISD